MKNYSRPRANKGKTTYRTPSRFAHNRPEQIKYLKVKAGFGRSKTLATKNKVRQQQRKDFSEK